jgi:hypothetical protein
MVIQREVMLSKAANQFYVNLFKCKLGYFKRWKFPLPVSIQKGYFFFDSSNRRESKFPSFSDSYSPVHLAAGEERRRQVGNVSSMAEGAQPVPRGFNQSEGSHWRQWWRSCYKSRWARASKFNWQPSCCWCSSGSPSSVPITIKRLVPLWLSDHKPTEVRSHPSSQGNPQAVGAARVTSPVIFSKRPSCCWCSSGCSIEGALQGAAEPLLNVAQLPLVMVHVL